MVNSSLSASDDATITRRQRLYRNLCLMTVLITLGLIMLGAGVRLTDAGLGCPDWPGCYGKLSPLHAAEEISSAVAAQGGEHGPVSMGKAWREMVHRYIAMGLGLLIIGLMVLGWIWRRDLPGGPWLATVLVGVVGLQGMFGKWTVTLLLKPAIVTGHLLGGLLTLGLLVWLWRRVAELPARVARVDVSRSASLRWAVSLGMVVLVAQIALGGWVSTNYAALACADFPTCQGKWLPDTDYSHAFHLTRELGQTATGEPLALDALTAIHLTHRIGAIVATAVLLWLVLAAWREPALRQLGTGLLLALIAQVALGISNVLLSLPLPIAIAHNGGAAVLIMMLVMLKFRVKSGQTSSGRDR